MKEIRLEGAPGRRAEFTEAADSGKSSVLTGGAEGQVGRDLRENELAEAHKFVLEPHRGLLAEAHARGGLLHAGGVKVTDPAASIGVGAQQLRLIDEAVVHGHHPAGHGRGNSDGAPIVLQAEERLPGGYLVANFGQDDPADGADRARDQSVGANFQSAQ